jgi:hypothetical protein
MSRTKSLTKRQGSDVARNLLRAALGIGGAAVHLKAFWTRPAQ